MIICDYCKTKVKKLNFCCDKCRVYYHRKLGDKVHKVTEKKVDEKIPDMVVEKPNVYSFSKSDQIKKIIKTPADVKKIISPVMGFSKESQTGRKGKKRKR